MLFADTETVAAAAATANTSLVLSVCTILLLPVMTLIVNKWAETRKQAKELEAAKAKLEADTDLAQAKLGADADVAAAKINADTAIAAAKIDADAKLAAAKLEIDSRIHEVELLHADCLKKQDSVIVKLNKCEARDEVTQAQLKKFGEFLERHESRVPGSTT